MSLLLQFKKIIFIILTLVLLATGPVIAAILTQTYDNSLSSTLAPYAVANYANLSGKSFPIGGIVTDGSAVWVRYAIPGQQTDGSVFKLTQIGGNLDQVDKSASNGCGDFSTIGLFHSPGMTATNIIFDGTNLATLQQSTGGAGIGNSALGGKRPKICFLNRNSGTASTLDLVFVKSNATDNPAWALPNNYVTKLLFDGQSYWTTIYQVFSGSYWVSKLSQPDSSQISVTTTNTLKTSGQILDMIWDGRAMWILEPGKIEKISATSSGLSSVDSITLPTQCSNNGSSKIFGNLVFDGLNVWASVGSGDAASNSCAELTKISPQKTLTKISLPALLSGPMALDQPGYASVSTGQNDPATYIWLADYFSGTLTKIATQSGSIMGTYKVGDGTNGVVFDGTYIWAANQLSKNVFRMRVR